MNSTANPAQKKLVVLIDDEPSVLTALKLLMTAIGFNVREFLKPLEAVAYLKGGGACDIIFCDLRMPELDGIGVLKEVKASRPELGFVLISGHATSEDVEHAKRLGVSAFLGKPFTPQQLKEMVELHAGK